MPIVPRRFVIALAVVLLLTLCTIVPLAALDHHRAGDVRNIPGVSPAAHRAFTSALVPSIVSVQYNDGAHCAHELPA